MQIADANGLYLNQEEKAFLPKGSKKDKKKTEKKRGFTLAREGQNKFRVEVLEKYEWACAVTGCTQVEALHAAHINPYSNLQNHHVSNGIALRADIHLLFDRGLLAINDTNFEVMISPHMQDGVYKELEGEKLRVPKEPAHYPSKASLLWHIGNVFRK